MPPVLFEYKIAVVFRDKLKSRWKTNNVTIVILSFDKRIETTILQSTMDGGKSYTHIGSEYHTHDVRRLQTYILRYSIPRMVLRWHSVAEKKICESVEASIIISSVPIVKPTLSSVTATAALEVGSIAINVYIV